MTTTTDRDQKVIDRVEHDLLSGRYFTLIANSNNSVPKGGPPIASRHWAQMMQAVARFASMSDWAADVAAHILGRVNQYATPNEAVAQVATRLAEVVREGWTDVRSATGPEPGRPSSHQHPTTLRRALFLALLQVEVHDAAGYTGSVAQVGWCVQALIEREGLTVHQVYLPATSKMIAR